MNDNHDLEILEALIELKKQIQEIRKVLSITGSTEDYSYVEPKSADSDDLKTELTPQEMHALLFTPFPDKPPKTSMDLQDTNDSDSDLRTDLATLSKRMENEIMDLRKSVEVLSEMWGRHEFELLKQRK